MHSTAAPSRFKRMLRSINRVFVVTVFIPTLAACVYYGLIASDIFISESRFVVRSPDRQVQTGLGSLLQGSGFGHTQDDTYAVQDFVLSRDALRELDSKLKLRAAFQSKNVDIFNRFGTFGRDGSFEAFHAYYEKHVGIDYDSTSSIAVLRVYAYSPETAQKMNEMLLEMGERLVNELNERSRQDLIDVAQKEVKSAEEAALNAALALSSFRTGSSVFDTTGQSALQMQSVTKLQQDLIQAEGQLAELQRVSPQNPQIATLSARVDRLRGAIAAESGKVTGNFKASLSSKAPEYDRLVLQTGFADKQLGAALASLSAARNEAAHKQLYLERLVEPNLPDSSMEPRRIRSILMIFLLGLVAWGVGTLLLASIREHTD
jgi:capsular polysaccharide transport system permease protein